MLYSQIHTTLQKKRTQKGTAAVVNWLALSRIRGILMITSSLTKGQNEKKIV